MPLQRLGMGVPGAVAELAVAAAVHDLLVIGGVGVLIGHDIIQVLGEGRGAVIQPVDVFAEAVIRDAHVGVHGAAGIAAGFGPVVARVGGVYAGGPVQDRSGAGPADERSVRIADVPGHGRLAVLGVLRGAPDAEAGLLPAAVTVKCFVGHGGVDIQLIGAVGGVHPAFRGIVVAVLLTGESGHGKHGHNGENDKKHRQSAATEMIGFQSITS